jgi:hypothetical protein
MRENEIEVSVNEKSYNMNRNMQRSIAYQSFDRDFVNLNQINIVVNLNSEADNLVNSEVII